MIERIGRMLFLPALPALPAPPPLHSPLPFARTLCAPIIFRARFGAPRTLHALAHALEDLDEAEIDLPDFHIHAHHLHLHFVAEAIGLVRVLPAQGVRALDE